MTGTSHYARLLIHFVISELNSIVSRYVTDPEFGNHVPSEHLDLSWSMCIKQHTDQGSALHLLTVCVLRAFPGGSSFPSPRMLSTLLLLSHGSEQEQVAKEDECWMASSRH